jgi:tetratricopeptide (TPR) repeat protein
MKYRCNECDITFEVNGESKPRCPKCMGIHDLSPLHADSSQEGTGSKQSFKIPLIILLVTAITAAAYFFLQKSSNEQQAGTFDNSDILNRLGLKRDNLTIAFKESDRIRKFAKSHAQSGDAGKALAELQKALTDLNSQNRWKALSQREPQMEPPVTADELLGKLLTEKPEKPYRVSSYEITALHLALARALDLKDINMVEIFSYKFQKIPADPDAIYGRYGLVVNSGKKNKTIYDVYAAMTTPADKVDFAILSDGEAMAPYYAQISLSYFAKMDMQNALKANETAIKLAPESAMYKIHRGKIFLGSGAFKEGLAEFEKAKKIKDWAVSKAALAQISLMSDPSGRSAEADIREALKDFPEYYQARIILATIHMQRGDVDEARQELEICQKQAPASPQVAFAFAQLHMLEHDSDKAIEMGKKAVRLSGQSYQSLLLMAKIYQATARFEEMREIARQAIEKSPSNDLKEQLRKEFNMEDMEEETEDTVSKTDSSQTDSATDSSKDTDSLDLNFDKLNNIGELKLKLNSLDTSPGGGKLHLGEDNNGVGKLRLNGNNY